VRYFVAFLSNATAFQTIRTQSEAYEFFKTLKFGTVDFYGVEFGISRCLGEWAGFCDREGEPGAPPYKLQYPEMKFSAEGNFLTGQLIDPVKQTIELNGQRLSRLHEIQFWDNGNVERIGFHEGVYKDAHLAGEFPDF
jgi:hypothetical protein